MDILYEKVASNRSFYEPVNMNTLKADAFEVLRKAGQSISCATPQNDSLISGSLGLAVYHYQVGMLFGTREDMSRAQELIKNALDRLNEQLEKEVYTSFASGLSGFCYAFNYFSERQFIEFDTAEFEVLDQYLVNTAISQMREHNNDYLHGAFGVLHYLLSRQQSLTIEEYVRSLLDEIHNSLEVSEDHFIRNHYYQGIEEKIDFGLAHGQAGLLLILLQAVEAGYDEERILGTADNIISFILKHLQEPTQEMLSYFPLHVTENTHRPAMLNRMAWCYGDLNICLLLYRFGQLFHSIRYQKVADLVGLSSIMRVSAENTLCKDSHFCHGSSGLASMYRALYVLRPLAEYKNAYHFWVRKTIDHLRSELNNGVYINKETSLLEGLVGPALTLASFVSEEELGWQKILLLP